MLTIWGCEVIKNRLFTSSKLSPLRTSAMSCAPLTIPCSRQILLSPSVYLVHSVPDGMFLIYFPMQKNWSTKAFGEKESNRSGDRKQNLCASKDDFPSFLWGRANNWPTSPTAVCFWRCRVVAPPCLDRQMKAWRKRQRWIMDEVQRFRSKQLCYSICCLLGSVAAFFWLWLWRSQCCCGARGTNSSQNLKKERKAHIRKVRSGDDTTSCLGTRCTVHRHAGATEDFTHYSKPVSEEG